MRVEFIKQLHHFCIISAEDAQFYHAIVKGFNPDFKHLLKHLSIEYICVDFHIRVVVYGWLKDKIKSWPPFFILCIVNGI